MPYLSRTQILFLKSIAVTFSKLYPTTSGITMKSCKTTERFHQDYINHKSYSIMTYRRSDPNQRKASVFKNGLKISHFITIQACNWTILGHQQLVLIICTTIQDFRIELDFNSYCYLKDFFQSLTLLIYLDWLVKTNSVQTFPPTYMIDGRSNFYSP